LFGGGVGAGGWGVPGGGLVVGGVLRDGGVSLLCFRGFWRGVCG
jgi:hypothetical protein